jgi:hypothetical protein
MLVWWRDDDAGRFSPRLDLLLGLAAETGRPLGLAVWCPLGSMPGHGPRPRGGWCFMSCSTAGRMPIMPAPGRSRSSSAARAGRAASLADLERGAAVLRAAFGERFLSVMVPPWNRIDERCMSGLARLGFRGLSTFADDARGPGHGLVHINTHVDLIDWRGGRRMKPLDDVVVAEIDRLLARPAVGVIGLLTHHLEMGLDDMARLRQVFAHIDRVGGCRWASPRHLFPSG